MDRDQTPCPLVPDLFRHLRLLFRVSLLRHAGLFGGGWRGRRGGGRFRLPLAVWEKRLGEIKRVFLEKVPLTRGR